jgi:hypothetical protein
MYVLVKSIAQGDGTGGLAAAAAAVRRQTSPVCAAVGVLCGLAVALVVPFALLSAATLYDCDIQSKHAMARPHSRIQCAPAPAAAPAPLPPCSCPRPVPPALTCAFPAGSSPR